MRLGILRTPNLAAANLAQLLLGAAWIPMWFFLNLYLQQVLGYGAFEGDATLLPMTAAIMLLMVVVAPRVVNRLGFKTPIVLGLLLLGTGMAILSLIRPDGTFAVDVLPASLIAAAGMALAFIPSLGTAISSARPEGSGLASGIVNTSYQVGSALGLAAMTPLQRPGRRPDRRRRLTHRRLLGRLPRRRRHRRRGRRTRRRAAAHPEDRRHGDRAGIRDRRADRGLTHDASTRR